MPAILNLEDVIFESRPASLLPEGAAAERFDARFGAVAARIGASKLGYNITAVPPGKSAFPFHNHWVNEEMVFVLQGAGTIRIGSETCPLSEGDFVALPPGDASRAHEIINTGSVELRYLAVSTRQSPEVGQYPDSGKFAVIATAPRSAGEQGEAPLFRFFGRAEQCLDYWDGEAPEK